MNPSAPGHAPAAATMSHARRRIRWRQRLPSLAWPGALGALGLAFALVPLARGRIFFFWDNAQQHFVQSEFLHRALGRGYIPHWWPSVGNGAPTIAEGQSAHFQPVRLLLAYLFSPEVGFMLEVAVYLSVAGLGTYFFLREFRIQRSACFAGGLCQMFGSYSVVFVRNVALHRSFFLLPLAMLLAERFATRAPRLRYGILAALVLAYQFLAGHPTFAIVTIAATTTYLVARLLQCAWHTHATLRVAVRHLAGSLIQWYAFLTLGVAAAGIQVVPTLLHVNESIRQGGLTFEYAVILSLPASILHLPQLLFPFVYQQGDFLREPTSWGSYFNRVPLLGIYIGIMPVVLAFWAAWRPRHWPQPTWPLAFCTLIAFAFALGPVTPLFPAFWSLPVLGGIRFPSRFLMWASFCISCLAAVGFHRLLVRRRSPRPLRLAEAVPFAAIAAAIIIIAGVFIWRLRSPYNRPLDIAPDFRNGIAISLALSAVCLALIAAILLTRRSVGRYFVPLVLVLVGFDLWHFRMRSGYAGTVPISAVHTPGPAAIFLNRDPGVFRVMSLVSIEQGWNRNEDLVEFVQANSTSLWGLDSADVYFSLFLKRYYAVHESLLWELSHSPDAAHRLAAFLGALNVKYVVAPVSIKLHGWRSVVSSARAVVWQNPAFLPRAFLVGRIVPERIVVRDEWFDRSAQRLENYRRMTLNWQSRLEDAQILDNILADTIDFARTAVVAGAELPNLDGAQPNGSVQLEVPTSDRMRIRVRSDRPALLAIASSYYPGWEATVNGRPARIYRTNYVSSGVPVPAGQSEVILSFETPGFQLGALSTALALLTCVIALVYGVMRRGFFRSRKLAKH